MRANSDIHLDADDKIAVSQILLRSGTDGDDVRSVLRIVFGQHPDSTTITIYADPQQIDELVYKMTSHEVEV